jgi:hypothetical protein
MKLDHCDLVTYNKLWNRGPRTTSKADITIGQALIFKGRDRARKITINRAPKKKKKKYFFIFK